MTDLIFRLSLHDERALHALVLRRRPWLDRAMRVVTHMGGASLSVGLTLVLLVGAVPSLRAAGALGAVALALSHAAVQVVKRTVSRSRPAMPVGLESLVAAPDRFSFPSGHSAASLSIALPVAMALGGLAGLALLAIGLVVGFSRCYLGVHYPGDVLAGWMLAVAGLWSGALLGF